MMASRIKTTRFWLAWIFASILVYPLVLLFIIAFSLVWGPVTEALFPDSLYYGFDSASAFETAYILVMGSIVGGIVGFAIGLLQRSVIKRYFHMEVKNWRRTTLIGGMIAAPVMVGAIDVMSNYVGQHYWQLMESGQYHVFNTILSVMPMVVYVFVLSAVQVIILRRYVQHAWLWIMANTVAGFMFSMVVNQAFDPGISNWLLAAIAQGAVTGFAMLWLLHRLNKETEADNEPEFAFQHVPIDNDDPSDPSIWDDAI